ncbi:transient receptor potential channel pyrexia-like isoform X2 [Homarus americanus]|nr:transient receptor potential channel pyrexia-like isoform X2 [Homarus americanus]
MMERDELGGTGDGGGLSDGGGPNGVGGPNDGGGLSDGGGPNGVGGPNDGGGLSDGGGSNDGGGPNDGLLPLLRAIKHHDLNQVREELLQRGELEARNLVCGNPKFLHTAASVLDLDIINLLLSLGAQVTAEDKEGNTVLHRAIAARPCDITAQDTIREILEIFLAAGADVNSTNQKEESPLYLAAHFQLPNIVNFLLSEKANPTKVTKAGDTVVHAACNPGCATCLKYLLNTGRVRHLVTQPNHKDVQPFMYALQSCSAKCCEILLNNGNHLTRTHWNNISSCSYLIQYQPTATELLTRVFDANIRESNQQKDNKLRIIFNYSVILPQTEGGRRPAQNLLQKATTIQSSIISDINNTEAECLLKHPLMETFIYLKWGKVKHIFHGELFIFALFLLCHTVYVASVYGETTRMMSDLTTHPLFRGFHAFLYCLTLIPELIIVISHFKSYFKYMETLLTATSVICSGYIVFRNITITGASLVSSLSTTASGNEEKNGENEQLSVERTVAAISIFTSWVRMMMLCGRLGFFGSNVLMFSRVAKSAVKFIAGFSGLLIGFSTSFFILFPEETEFNTFWKSLAKTLTMMIGEIDYSSLVKKNTPYIVYIFLVLFIFLVCVLMANLLIGLAVDDIANLRRNGEVEKLSRQATFIVTFENFAVFARNSRFFPRRLATYFIELPKVKDEKSFKINEIKSKKSFLCRYDLPRETVEKAQSIAKSNQTLKHEELTMTPRTILNEIKKLRKQLENFSTLLQFQNQNQK